jgi:hypothetical protein
MAEQFYCEKMVELSHLHGKTETEEMKSEECDEGLLEGMLRVKPETCGKDREIQGLHNRGATRLCFLLFRCPAFSHRYPESLV